MEIINSRYKIINKINTQLSHINEFLAVDLWSENEKINLKLVSSLELPKEELNFFKDKFITISSIDNYFHIKNYGFSSLSQVYPPLSHSSPDEIIYIFTTEYLENTTNVLEFAKKASMEDLLKIVIEVCQSLVHASNIGFEYDIFSPDNVIIQELKEGFKIRIKDIVSTKLENTTAIRFREAQDYTGTNENIETVIAFIVSLLTGQEIKTNLASAIERLKASNKYKNLDKSAADIFNALYKVLKKQIKQHKDKKIKIHSIIQIINEQLGRSYPADIIFPLNSLTFRPKLVGRQKEIDMITQSRIEINSRKAKKNVFIVKGGQGAGKTRFLKEAEYRLALEGTNIYSNYNLKNSTSEYFWDDFLSKIFLNSYSLQDIAERENIIQNIKRIRDHKNRINSEKEYEHLKFKIFSEAKNFFFKTIGHLPSFFIIDDVELANDFILDTILYLATEITDLERLGVIVSYDESVSPTSSKFTSFLQSLANYKKTQLFELNDFSEEETVEMVRNTLLLKYPPLTFGPFMYKYTSGCPSFIIEMIKEFVNSGIIYRETETGIWVAPDEIYTDALEKKIPKSIEETLTNQINALSPTSKNLLLEISLFQNIFKIDYLYKVLTISRKKIDKIIKEFINKGLVTVIKNGDKLEYAITNKIMRNILYKLIDHNHKILQHKKISKILKKETDADMNELIWHLEESGNKKAALNCCLDIAEQKMKTKDINSVIKIYEKIPLIITNQNIKDRFRILLNIFDLYHQMGLKNKELELKSTLVDLLPKIKNAELLSHFYSLMANHEYSSLNEEATLSYVKKLSKLYTSFPSDIINLRLNHSKCLYYHIKQQNEGFKEVTYKILMLTKNNPKYISYRTDAYIFLGYIYHTNLKKKKALKAFQKAKELASLSNSIKTELIAMYNISVIYWDINSDIDKIISYTKDVITMAKKLGFLSIEMISTINYARMLCEIQNNYEAYEYAKGIEDKIFNYDIVMLKLPHILAMMEITQSLSRYEEFFQYRKKYINIAKANKAKAVYQHNFAFYLLMAKTYQEFGYNNRAIAYFKKSIKIKKYQPSNNMFMIYFMLETSKIIQCKKSNIDKLIKIFNSYIKHNQKLNKRNLNRVFFDSVITLTIKRPDLDFSPLILEIIKFDSNNLYYFQQSGMHYLKTYLNKSTCENLLQKDIQIIKQKKIINISLFLNISLGKYYLLSGIQSLAIIHFLESQRKIKELIRNTPEKYIVKLFNNWSFNKPFDIISAFIKGKDITKEKISHREVNRLEIEAILKLNHTSIIQKDKNFKTELSHSLLKHQGYDHTTSVEIINTFTDNYIKNIANVMHFLSLNVLASVYEFLELDAKGGLHFILRNEDEDGSLNCIADLMAKFGYQNISKIEKEFYKPCMIIPVNKKAISNNENTVLGFMIFISENLINNFSSDGRNFCKKHSNLLTMLLESKNFQQSAEFDALTGAYTRKHFESFLNNLVVSSANSKFSIILYDLDKFKSINDTYGHLVGDIVLKKVAHTILNSLDKGQILGRYGGEEFIIVLPDADMQKALKTAEYLRKKVENLFFTEFEKTITISLGIACFPKNGTTASELITKADQALYYSKNTGRNKTTVWRSAIMNKNSGKIIPSSIVVSDENSFASNLADTIELCDILKTNLAKNKFEQVLLSHIMKFFEVESGAIILTSTNKKNGKLIFKISTKIGFDSYTINENLVNMVARNGVGIYQVDWDEIARRNSITNMPEWNSVMLTPLIKKDSIIGLLYLATPEKQAKFNLSKFNFFKFIADIISANI